jgi:hypothetical protein
VSQERLCGPLDVAGVDRSGDLWVGEPGARLLQLAAQLSRLVRGQRDGGNPQIAADDEVDPLGAAFDGVCPARTGVSGVLFVDTLFMG